MTIDHERIERVFEQITAENLNMAEWAAKTGCGTTMCFAGHVVAEAGIPMDWQPGYFDEYDAAGWTRVSGYQAGHTLDGRIIEEVAQELLGFDTYQAEYVFYATHIESVDALRKRVNQAVTGEMFDHPEDL